MSNGSLRNSLLPERFRNRAVIEKSQTFVSHVIGGVARQFALPITFTPFASVKPCSARCQFCSEALIHKDATALSASLRPQANYGTQLRTVLAELRGLKVGLSLSGLEATADEAWLLDVLKAAAEHESSGGVFDEKVLYSNGTGLVRTPDSKAGSHKLLSALKEIGLTRIEMSRHSPHPSKNAAIMRFREGITVAQTEEFEGAVRNALEYVPVKLVCVLQKGGVESLSEIEEYLHWAASLGVSEVVFRELSRLHDLYKPNLTYKYVEAARVAIESLVDSALENETAFKAEEVTDGYYYWNAKFNWNNKVTAIFETSDYLLMKQLHHSDTVYKMVFHANGKLCADWDPNTRVLMEVV